MSGEFVLKLAHPELLARRFQYAFLSLNPEVFEFRPESGEAVFRDEEDFRGLVREALNAVLETSMYTETRTPCSMIVEGIDCCRLDKGPSLYTAGASDLRLLAKAGLDVCLYTSKTGKRIVAWTHAAVSYALKVLKRDPLPSEELDLPWLAKASLFSKTRSASGGVETRRLKADIHVLGTTLLGGALSFMGSYPEGRGQERVEYYLVPEAPSREFNVLRLTASLGGRGGNLAGISATLMNEFGVSLEAAVSLAFAVKLNDAGELAYQLGANRIAASARLLRVTPQKRPLARGAIPVSPVMHEAFSGDTIRNLYSALGKARKMRGGNEKSQVVGVLRSCIHGMFMQALSPCHSDHLYSCVRDLDSTSYAVSRRIKNDELAETIESLVRRLARDYNEMVRTRCQH